MGPKHNRFQEELVSRRALYFVDSKVYFRCGYGVSSEEVDADFVPPSHISLEPQDEQLWHQPRVIGREVQATPKAPHTVWHDTPNADDVTVRFSTMLQRYTGRALRDEGDIERALKNALRRFSEEMNCEMLEGIPSAAVDVFMKSRREVRSFGFGVMANTFEGCW